MKAEKEHCDLNICPEGFIPTGEYIGLAETIEGEAREISKILSEINPLSQSYEQMQQRARLARRKFRELEKNYKKWSYTIKPYLYRKIEKDVVW